MAKRFDYRVCHVQQARVTFVNGQWYGKQPPDAGPRETALESCPTEWDYLRLLGEEGWELVAVVAGQGGDVDNRTLYCRRDMDQTESTELVTWEQLKAEARARMRG